MRTPYRVVLLLVSALMLGLAPAGCQQAQGVAWLIAGGTPTPLPTYTLAPTYTPAPTYTVAPTYTPYPTFTPLPTQRPTRTPTRVPTATPVPTPMVEIPEAWVEYVDVVEGFTVRHPAEWKIYSSSPDHVTFDLRSYGLCSVDYDAGFVLEAEIGTTASLNQLVEMSFLYSMDFAEKLLEKGTLEEPYPMNYVLIEISSIGGGGKGQHLIYQRALDDGTFVLARLIRGGGAVRAVDKERAQIILASFMLGERSPSVPWTDPA